jgi:hypothetical protein
MPICPPQIAVRAPTNAIPSTAAANAGRKPHRRPIIAIGTTSNTKGAFARLNDSSEARIVTTAEVIAGAL